MIRFRIGPLRHSPGGALLRGNSDDPNPRTVARASCPCFRCAVGRSVTLGSTGETPVAPRGERLRPSYSHQPAQLDASSPAGHRPTADWPKNPANNSQPLGRNDLRRKARRIGV